MSNAMGRELTFLCVVHAARLGYPRSRRTPPVIDQKTDANANVKRSPRVSRTVIASLLIEPPILTYPPALV
jgi:hypothetical protein